MKDVNGIINQITSKWFLRDPFLFSVYCTHQLVENNNMDCCIRSGKLRIEYNAVMLAVYSRDEIDNLLRREVLRIILKHPYQRQPMCVVPKLAYLASNLTLYLHGGTGINPIKHSKYEMLKDFLQNTHPSFEELYRMLLTCGVEVTDADLQNYNGEESQEKDNPSNDSTNRDEIDDEVNNQNETYDSASDTESATSLNNFYGQNDNSDSEMEPDCIVPKDLNKDIEDEDDNSTNTGTGDDNECSQPSVGGGCESKDATALWEEDPLFSERINCAISEADNNSWGTLPGNIQELIKASAKAALNLMRKLEMFRASILSTGQCCTRMRPSRRYGWSQMGRLHPYCSRLLLGIDTSGSIENEDLRKFFSIINSFFSVGFPEIDVLMFDVKIYLPVVKLRSVRNTVTVVGRGGTDFTEVLGYFRDNLQYDGLIMFTDGYAFSPIPVMPPGRKVLWALKDRTCYEKFALEPKIYLPN